MKEKDLEKQLKEAEKRIEELEKAMEEVYIHIDKTMGEFEEVYKILSVQQDRIRHLYIIKRDD